MLKNLITKSIILFFISSPLLLIAGETERWAAKDLLVASGFEKTINDMNNTCVEMIKQKDPSMSRYENVIRAFYKKYASAESIREEAIDLYTEIFTENELKEITAFYQTATGQKTLEHLPKIMDRCMQMIGTRVTQNSNELVKMLLAEQDNR